MLKYRFSTQEFQNEMLNVIWAGSPYEMLGNISASYLSRVPEVEKAVANLERVVAGVEQSYGWGEDNCAFSSEQDLTYIDYDFGDHTITIPTAEILQLLRDWLAYLQQKPQPA